CPSTPSPRPSGGRGRACTSASGARTTPLPTSTRGRTASSPSSRPATTCTPSSATTRTAARPSSPSSSWSAPPRPENRSVRGGSVGLARLVVDAVGVLGRPEDHEDDELLLDLVEPMGHVRTDEDHGPCLD